MYLVMAVGINFMFRKGEHIRKSDGKDSGLTRNNVTFLDYSGRRIPYHLVGDPSYKAKKMTINTRFSKTDHSGFGRRPWHERQESPAKEEVCVVTLVERWVAMTRDLGAKEDDELFTEPAAPAAAPQKGKKTVIAPKKKVDLSFYAWEHDGKSYIKNDRGDVIEPEEGCWVGRFDGSKIDESIEEPTDLDGVTMRE
jgi:hypothetical protein